MSDDDDVKTVLMLYSTKTDDPRYALISPGTYVDKIFWGEAPRIGETVYTREPGSIGSDHGKKTTYKVVVVARTDEELSNLPVYDVVGKKIKTEEY